ncbi:MAG: periplasmic heavy metal sensor [Nannocystaceae bacterium]
MNKKNLAQLLAFSLSLNLAVVAVVAYHHLGTTHCADRCRAQHPHRRPGGNWHEKLALSEAQRATFDDLKADFAGQKAETHDRIASLREQLKLELGTANPSRPRIDQLLAEMSADQASLQGRFVDLMFSMQAALGPGQSPRFQRILERHLVSPHPTPRPGHGPGHRPSSH